MSGFLARNWFKLAIILILLAMIASFGYKLWFGGAKTDERLTVMKKAPDFQLQDMDGKQINSADLNGKVKLVYFFYSSCPDVCQPTTFQISKIQDALKGKGYLGDKAQILSITFDPDKDTPSVLKEFSRRFNADPEGWKFLREDEAAVRALAEKFGIIVVEDKEGNLTHSNAILLVDGKGDLRNYYSANDPALDTELIVNDVIALSKE